LSSLGKNTTRKWRDLSTPKVLFRIVEIGISGKQKWNYFMCGSRLPTEKRGVG